MFVQKIGFIGAGHLNTALLAGLLQDKRFSADRIWVSSRSKETAERIAAHYKVKCHTDNRILLEHCDCLVLGVKPAQMLEVLRQLSAYDLSQKLIITVAAGIHVEAYRRILGEDCRLVRTMPNIAAAKQASLTGIFTEDDLSEDEEALTEALFAAVGGTEWLDDETQIDGITALSGSGIALIYRVMQAMAKEGEAYGFSPEALYDIMAQTVFGAAVLALEAEENANFADFIGKIARKGGTTEAALKVLEAGKIDALFAASMQAAVNRSQAMNEEITQDWN